MNGLDVYTSYRENNDTVIGWKCQKGKYINFNDKNLYLHQMSCHACRILRDTIVLIEKLINEIRIHDILSD